MLGCSSEVCCSGGAVKSGLETFQWPVKTASFSHCLGFSDIGVEWCGAVVIPVFLVKFEELVYGGHRVRVDKVTFV